MQTCQQHGTAYITANGRCAECDRDNARYAASSEFKNRAPKAVDLRYNFGLKAAR